ncbi:MAG: four helix bundle protein [Bacillota bacterium]
MMQRDFEDLIVWQKSHKLALQIYEITKDFPKEELYGLTPQIRRASSSIPMNIAEGTGLKSYADFRRLLAMARGSLMELRYQLRLCKDLGYINADTYFRFVRDYDEVGKMLNGLITSLECAINNKPKK